MILKFFRKIFSSTESIGNKPDSVNVPSNEAGMESFDLDSWIRKQKDTYSDKPRVVEQLHFLEKKSLHEVLGLEGKVIDDLLNESPILIPVKAWGADVGWRSKKRRKRWEKLLRSSGIDISERDNGCLVRFAFDPREWIPHPYAPPHWMLLSFESFSQFVVDSREAYEVCQNWRRENAIALTRKLTDRLSKYNILLAASYRIYKQYNYAEVAFLLSETPEDFLSLRSGWKSEAELAILARRFYPDTVREYSPPWLGEQRLDIFIPSLKLAIEYNGAQHYRPIEFFGGKEAFKANKKRDERKARACEKNGIALITWHHNLAITEDNFRRKIEAAGYKIATSNP